MHKNDSHLSGDTNSHNADNNGRIIGKNRERGDISYEEVVQRNRQGIKLMQAKYFQDQYERSISSRIEEQSSKQREKEKELDLFRSLNKHYLEDISTARVRKQQERSLLSSEYEEEMSYQKKKSRYEKQVEKSIEKQVLCSPSWIRDSSQERKAHRKNIQYYSQALNDHVKAQQENKAADRQKEIQIKNRIQEEADRIIQKEFQYLQARHNQKSLFEKRQNQLLGATERSGSQNIAFNQDARFAVQETQAGLRKKEKAIYGQGLELQMRRDREKRSSVDRTPINQHNSYNPITNPIPFQYKNPNVLRMLSLH